MQIGVDVARATSTLSLMYIVYGDVAAVALPKQATSVRTDGLWQHTCFEAFVRNVQSAAYWEFNVSPSLQWAAYRFNAYREGMAAEPAIADPHIAAKLEGSELRLWATIDLSSIAALSACSDWHLGLSAVIEDRCGGKSYWALAHQPGKPDFHHADSFALHLECRNE